jgi:hypothetical protein
VSTPFEKVPMQMQAMILRLEHLFGLGTFRMRFILYINIVYELAHSRCLHKYS